MKGSARAVSSILILFALATSADAQPVADFYRGKQIRVIVGTAPGDYDTWARIVARHMRQYLPGNPNFVVENMPGAGSLIAANYLYNKAAQDGTVLGSVSRNIPNFAFTKKPNVFFDPLKYNWIGSPEMTNRGCYARTDSGVQKVEDLYKNELLVGTDGAGTSLSEMPTLLKNLLGMKFKTSTAIVDRAVSFSRLSATKFPEFARLCRLSPNRRRTCWTTARYVFCSPRNAIGCRVFRFRQFLNMRKRTNSAISSRSTRPAWRPAGPAHASRRAAGSGRCLAPGIRRHHEGPGVSR